MKRICFLTDSIFSYGGVQRVTAVIAKQLAFNDNVTIVTFDQPGAKNTSFYDLNETNITYRFFNYPTRKSLKNLFCKAYSACYRKLHLQWQWASRLYAHSSFPSEWRKALLQELNDGHYDVIVGVHAPLAARLATMKPRLKKVRCIGWIHNSFDALYGPKSLYIGPELKRHYVYQLRRLDEVVVLCKHDAEHYTHYDSVFKPIVIYNPLTLQPGRPSDGTSKRFLAVGRFSHLHKGFDVLIDAFHLFAKKNADWMLDIVGEGPEETMYRERIAKYGLEQRIEIHPFTNHIQSYYSQAQIFVLSSRWEGLPLVLVEAMSHGLPIVSSNIPSSLEILGDFGLYFENEDASQLAQRLFDATKLDWPKKSREALEIASHFDVASITKQWKEVLHL